MIRSATHFTFVISLILVEVYAVPPPPSLLLEETPLTWNYKADVSDPKHPYNDKDIVDEQSPSMSCLLFGNAACHVQCYLSIEIFYKQMTPASICTDEQHCHCHYRQGVFFHNIWQIKFNQNYAYRAIMYNNPLFDYVKNVFRDPFRTAEKLRQIIKPSISPYTYSKMEVRKDNSAEKFIAEDGKINEESVHKYVSNRLRPIFNSKSKFHFYEDYKQNLKNALKNARDEGSLYNITYAVRGLKNQELENILQEHFKTHRLKEPEIEVDETEDLNEVLEDVIIREIIRHRDQMDEDPEFTEQMKDILRAYPRKF